MLEIRIKNPIGLDSYTDMGLKKRGGLHMASHLKLTVLLVGLTAVYLSAETATEVKKSLMQASLL